ncbi:peptide deformylase [Thalassoglobus sp. JC818]|uniref:peptide deformylase n=1 Tax=Thalassoglobus sp. JC818 TaxID=3232136 RepID=UPI00345A2A4C
MEIIHFPHPALRFQSVDVQRIDSSLRKTIQRMFELMYEANGIGLAANQVGLPFRFFIVNLAARPDEPDEELVFINPVIRKRRGNVVGEEGCLSLPGLFGDVTRSEQVTIEAFDLSGQGFTMDLSELPARVVQHESDHLDGVMFTDRMREEANSEEVDLILPKFESNFRDAQQAGHFRTDQELEESLKEMAASGGVPAGFVETSVYRLTPPKLDSE